MTTMKHVTIEFADILSVNFHCDGCSSTLSIPIEKMDRELPKRCPYCTALWGAYESNSPIHLMDHVKEVFRVVDKIKARMHNSGFTLALEVSSDVLDPVSTSKD